MLFTDSKEDKVAKDWGTAIELGAKYKKDHSDCDRWDTYRSYYRGEFGDSAHCEVPLNMTFSYIRSMIPRLYFRTPGILAIPSRPEFVAHSRVVEALDNWLIRETNLKYELKRAILQGALTGIGPIKLGYDSEYGYSEDNIADINSGTVTQVSQKDGKRIEYNTNIKPGMPWAMSVQPDNIITPYGYSRANDLPWIAEMVLRPVEDIKQDQKYNNKRKKVVGGFSIPHDVGNAFSAFKNTDKGKYALMYEIRCLKTGKFYIMCEDMILYEQEDSLQIEGLPYEHIIFNEDPEHFWPISDVRMLKAQQDELNEIRAHARRMRRLDQLKFLYLKGSISETQLEQLLSSDPYDMGIGIEIQGEHIGGAIDQLRGEANTQNLIREQEQTMSDMRNVMGFSENQMGNYVPFHNKTAQEAQIVNQAASIRSDERRDIVADVLSNILRKWNQFVFKYWEQPRVVEIVGNDGYQYWIKYTGDQLRGEYSLNIQPEEGMPISREVRHQTANELFGMLNQDPMIDQVGLRRLLLQQTDIIDPSYMGLIRPPTPNPNMTNGPQNPIGFDEILPGGPMEQQVLGPGGQAV